MTQLIDPLQYVKLVSRWFDFDKKAYSNPNLLTIEERLKWQEIDLQLKQYTKEILTDPHGWVESFQK